MEGNAYKALCAGVLSLGLGCCARLHEHEHSLVSGTVVNEVEMKGSYIIQINMDSGLYTGVVSGVCSPNRPREALNREINAGTRVKIKKYALERFSEYRIGMFCTDEIIVE